MERTRPSGTSPTISKFWRTGWCPGCGTGRLSVVRVRPGQPAFMQKNLPKYTPEWVERVRIWAEASKREVSYPLANDRRTLLWFANQRAVEYHVTLFRVGHADEPDYLVMDLDPPEGAGFSVVAQAAMLVRSALDETGLQGAVKTSGAKGLHVFVPLADGPLLRTSRLRPGHSPPGPNAWTRSSLRRRSSRRTGTGRCSWIRPAPAARPWWRPTAHASVQVCRSPSRWPGRPGPRDAGRLHRSHRPGSAGLRRSRGATRMPDPQTLPADLVAEGHEIPIARVQAMHEGKRRARASGKKRERRRPSRSRYLPRRIAQDEPITTFGVAPCG